MATFSTIAACRYVSLTEIGPFRQRLITLCRQSQLRGTILLSREGLRLCLVGPPGAVALLLREVRAHPGLATLEAQVTTLRHQPFEKTVVRILRQIPARPLASIAPDPAMSLAPMAERIEQRHQRIRQAVNPLPGRQPFDNFKPVKIPAECDGGTLLNALCCLVRHLPVSQWESECALGRLLDTRQEIIAAHQVVRAGDQYWHKFPGVLEPDVDGRVKILHEDEALVVINKPAPLPMHAGGRFFRNTLQYVLNAAYHPEKLRPAHRLDANTTGLVLVTRTQQFAGRLQPQFSCGRVKKLYLVRVQGQPKTDHFHCDAPISSESGELGSRTVDFAAGRAARTEFRVLRRDTDGTSLLEARPLTGRTHQIRVHLWHLGLAVCGDPVYLAGNRLGHTQTLELGQAPLCLHAWRIGCTHPLTQEPVEFTAPPPAWAGTTAYAETNTSLL
jgi:RluA family pseudouridine synthase